MDQDVGQHQLRFPRGCPATLSALGVIGTTMGGSRLQCLTEAGRDDDDVGKVGRGLSRDDVRDGVEKEKRAVIEGASTGGRRR